MPSYKEITTVDDATGEVLRNEKFIRIKTSSDEFYMTYIKFMSSIFEIKSITDVQVLAKMCMMMGYNTNQVSLPSSKRKEICDSLKIQNSNLSHSIKRLKALGLISGDGGVYEIDPKIYWKGTNDNRQKLLSSRGMKLTVDFADRDEPEFKTEE